MTEQDIPTQTFTNAALRAPFPPERVGKLPRITCGNCRNSRGKVCDNHTKNRCTDCGNWVTTAHIHLDFVSHADVTDRLLEVDPGWYWEPLALDSQGLPAFDQNGGMWIRLTVAEITRLGYGDAPGKEGGDAIKEVIGDAIRNAAMRFGVALDLWRKEPAVDEVSSSRPQHGQPPRPVPASRAAEATAREALAVYNGFLQDLRRCGQPAEVKALGGIVRGALDKGCINESQYNQLDREAAKKLQELDVKPKEQK